METVYKKTFITLFTWLSLLSHTYAQEEEVISGPENQTVVINWSAIEQNLVPLEEIQIQEPQLSTGVHGERQTYLRIGQPAPWTGVLLSPPAVAFIISEYQASWERAQAALLRQRESDWNRLRLEVDQLLLQVITDRKQVDIVVGGLNREIVRLQQIHEDYVHEQTGGFWNTDFGQTLKWGLVVAGSAAVGVVIGRLSAAL